MVRRPLTLPLLACFQHALNLVASELITNREIVSARIRDDLLNRAKEFNIMLEDVSIVRPAIFHDCLSLSHVDTSADQRDIDAHDVR